MSIHCESLDLHSCVRLQLDRLTIDDVLWDPYTEHRANCSFVSISLFCGYLCSTDTIQRLSVSYASLDLSRLFLVFLCQLT